jgi:sugar phosphate isomerase/epimerase
MYSDSLTNTVPCALQQPHGLSRRAFLARSAALSAAATLLGPRLLAAAAPGGSGKPPLVVFSKVYQELKLSFAQAAELTADAGLDGIDCPVRPGGEILPERATEDLPRYAALLRQRGLSMPLITTGITSADSPHAEEILRASKKLGTKFYRLGTLYHESGTPVSEKIKSFRTQLQGLAKMNREIGLGALVQNHSPSGRTYLGGNLEEMRAIVEGFEPGQIGVAFDIGHALIVHGDEWRKHFEALKSHIKIIYIKDAKREGRWVRFGDGDVGKTDYFKLLKQMNYDAPVSIHIEYDWVGQGEPKTREALLEVLRHSAAMVRQWLSV